MTLNVQEVSGIDSFGIPECEVKKLPKEVWKKPGEFQGELEFKQNNMVTDWLVVHFLLRILHHHPVFLVNLGHAGGKHFGSCLNGPTLCTVHSKRIVLVEIILCQQLYLDSSLRMWLLKMHTKSTWTFISNSVFSLKGIGTWLVWLQNLHNPTVVGNCTRLRPIGVAVMDGVLKWDEFTWIWFNLSLNWVHI